MQKRVKIMIVVTSPVSAVLIAGMPAYLSSKGFEVAVCSGAGREMSLLAQKEGIYFHPLPLEREISVLKDIRALLGAMRFIRRYRPDIVNAGTPKAAFICMTAAWICRVPVRIFTFHGMRSSTLTGIRRRIVSGTEKVSAALAHKVIAVSPSLRKEAEAQGIIARGKCLVLLRGSANGIDLERFSYHNKEAAVLQLKKQLGVPEHHFVLGFAGRLTRDKGVAELYEAYRLLKQQHDIIMILAGPGEAGDALPASLMKALKEDRHIICTGFVPDIEYYYPLFDVLALPSYREGWGNAIIEAAAMGVPAVATDVTGCRDAVVDGVTGLLCRARSAQDLADKIAYYILHPEIRKLHGMHATARAQQQFASGELWQAQYDLYTELLRQKGIHTVNAQT